MLKIFIILVWCQTGLQSVSCNDQHDSGSLLQCDSNCTLPEFPGNGRYTVLGALADTHPGAVVPNSTIIQYNCDVNYVPYPHSTAVCIDGRWDTQFTKCQRKVTCPLPTNPAHGSYVLSDLGGLFVHGTDVPNWSTAIYSCDATFEIVGNRTALCYNGLWTTEPPQCRKTTACVVPGAPTKGSYSILGSQDAPVAGSTVKENQVLKYDCPTPNIFQGPPVIYCENGNWLPEVPSCSTKKPCTLPAVPVNARINAVQDVNPSLPGIHVPSLSNIEYSCDATFELIGTANISCSDGSWSSEPPQCQTPPSDCGDVLRNTSGVYLIKPTSNTEPFDTYCDLTLVGQKWTVIQQRFNGDIYFNRSYTEYSAGFGPKMGNHWLGLEHIHEITKGGHHELYVELEAYNGTKAYARYETFIVGNSSTGFQLTISVYRGTAGDSMYKPPGHSDWHLNGMKFSTYDKDQDTWSNGDNAEEYKGAWWYAVSSFSNLNGLYKDTAEYGSETMRWYHNFGNYALKTSRMLIRRK